jgi:hypothetical protein
MICMKYKKSFEFLKNLNSLYPADIKKEFIKMRLRFIELEKNTYEKELSHFI